MRRNGKNHEFSDHASNPEHRLVMVQKAVDESRDIASTGAGALARLYEFGGSKPGAAWSGAMMDGSDGLGSRFSGSQRIPESDA